MKPFKEYIHEVMTDPETTIKELKDNLKNAGIDYTIMSYEDIFDLLKKDFSKKEASFLANSLKK